MPAGEQSSCSSWTREEDKLFERAIVTYRDEAPDRWEKVASEVPGKSVEEVKQHYELLIEDVNRIDSGFVELPCYSVCSDGFDESGQGGTKSLSRSDQERRKGIAWTEDEHRLFLLGLEKYGKGDWRGISRNFVVTRTPTQVASHAQKYFIRLNSMNKNRRRSSIHDITSVNTGEVSVPQGPITGKTNAHQPSMGVYGIGQCIGGPAVGTPVNLPAPGHMAYGLGAPVPGSAVGMAPMARPQVVSLGHESVTRGTKSWQNK